MTTKTNATSICDRCGRSSALDEDLSNVVGWGEIQVNRCLAPARIETIIEKADICDRCLKDINQWWGFPPKDPTNG